MLRKIYLLKRNIFKVLFFLFKMKIIVTGGAGFIGSNLIKELVKSKEHVIVSIDNYSAGTITNHITGVTYINANTWDILNIDIHDFKNFKADIVFHFAEYSRIHQSFKEISQVFKSNTYGTQQVLEYAVRNKSKLIYSGSSAIFGNKENENLSPYALTKYNNIKLIHNYNKWFGLEFCICYFFNVYGEGQIKTGNYATVIGIFESQYSSNSPLTIVKPGTQSRCFTHIDDIIKGILLIMQKGSGDGYLLGSKEEISINEVAKMFDTSSIYIEERKGERNFSKFENSRSETELGWTAHIKLKDYIDRYKKNFSSVFYRK